MESSDISVSSSSSVYLSVVIPAYNEEERVLSPLEKVVEYLARQTYTWEIICVDDGSRDATKSILETASNKWERVRVVSYDRNRGKGYAVKQGVLASKGSFILFSDADLNTPIEEIEKLLAQMESCDIAIGSRSLKRQDRPILRELGSRFLNLLIRLLAVPGIRDTQCGFKLFRLDAAKKIFGLTILERFSFDIEVLYLARRLGYTVVEVPVTWYYRGGSKVHPVADGLRFVRDMLRIRRHCYGLGGGKQHE